MNLENFCGMILLVFLLAGCGSFVSDSRVKGVPDADERLLSNYRTGELEGFEAINLLIQNRLLNTAAPTSVNFGIEAVGGPGILDVKEMLGSYETESDRSDFLHGEPNPFNVMLWHNQLGILAQAIGATCHESGTMEGSILFPAALPDLVFEFKPELRAILQSLCLLPLDKRLNPQSLEKLWLYVMSYDAPQEEELAWQDFFLADDRLWTTRAERLSALIFTMFMNPYFILQE